MKKHFQLPSTRKYIGRTKSLMRRLVQSYLFETRKNNIRIVQEKLQNLYQERRELSEKIYRH
jgi:hypothetical protein